MGRKANIRFKKSAQEGESGSHTPQQEVAQRLTGSLTLSLVF
jgi:hypothetical protein